MSSRLPASGTIFIKKLIIGTMLRSLPSQLRGVVGILLYAFNTIFWCLPLFCVALFKLMIPIGRFRSFCNQALNFIANAWIGVNNTNQLLISNINWDVSGIGDLKRDNWYMVLANHQSWVDILVLQKIFHRRIPLLKFFLKKELIWVPFLGLAWWALDFPFIKRYSKSFLEKHPHLTGVDFETTRRACRKFQSIPISVMNFVEGTRFSTTKHHHQHSPYKHLLKAKAGGLAFVMSAMGEQMHRLLDVTIVYPNGIKSFWDYLCGRISEIRVRVKAMPISPEMIGDYGMDRQYRHNFQKWLNQLWMEKDRCIDGLLVRS